MGRATWAWRCGGWLGRPRVDGRAGFEVTAAHEHFLSASLKVFLGQVAKQFATPDNAPGIIVATPVGQLHELGALMVTYPSTHGVFVLYLVVALFFQAMIHKSWGTGDRRSMLMGLVDLAFFESVQDRCAARLTDGKSAWQ